MPACRPYRPATMCVLRKVRLPSLARRADRRSSLRETRRARKPEIVINEMACLFSGDRRRNFSELTPVRFSNLGEKRRANQRMEGRWVVDWSNGRVRGESLKPMAASCAAVPRPHLLRKGNRPSKLSIMIGGKRRRACRKRAHFSPTGGCYGAAACTEGFEILG